jgi:acetyl esterase
MVLVRRTLLILAAALLTLGSGAGAGAGARQAPTVPTRAAPAAVPFHVTHDVRYGTAGGHDLLLDTYVPDDTNAERVSVVLIHGGAWRTGDKRDVVQEATLMAQRGWVVFAVNYRLGETDAFPAEIDDVETAVRWARANAYEYRMDAGRMGALGFSAGGHLAAMLATLGEGPPDRGGRVLVAASWSGPMDLAALTTDAPVLSALLLSCPPAACPQRWKDASPIDQVDPTDAPLFLANSDHELVPVEQARSMAARAETAGVENQLVVVAGSRHGDDLHDDVWAATVAFLDEHLTRPTDLKTPNPKGTGVLVVAILVIFVGGLIGGLRVRHRLNAVVPPKPEPGGEA